MLGRTALTRRRPICYVGLYTHGEPDEQRVSCLWVRLAT